MNYNKQLDILLINIFRGYCIVEYEFKHNKGEYSIMSPHTNNAREKAVFVCDAYKSCLIYYLDILNSRDEYKRALHEAFMDACDTFFNTYLGKQWDDMMFDCLESHVELDWDLMIDTMTEWYQHYYDEFERISNK